MVNSFSMRSLESVTLSSRRSLRRIKSDSSKLLLFTSESLLDVYKLGFDPFFSVHIRTQHLRNRNGTISILVEFQNRDQDTRRCDHGIIQRMTEDVLSRGVLIPQVHPPA